MSLPPEDRVRRGRGKPKRVGGTPAAQMDHASGGKAKKHHQEGEAKMEADRYGASRTRRRTRPGSVENPGEQEDTR